MNLSRIFILRPIATTLAMVAIFLFGMLGYRSLPMAALPEVDYPTIQVVTLYPGAGPEVITAMVTAPLERQFGQMSGLKQMSSTSSGGASVITLQFGLDLDLDVAEQEVQAAINTASNLLPADLPSAPIYNKVNPADPPIITLAVSSSSLAMTRVQDLVDTRIAQRMSQVTGVGLVALSGGQRPAVRINLNPQALAANGLSSEQVRNRVTVMNTNSPKGGFDGESRSLSISANDQLQTAQEYGDIILAYSNGAAVRLRDVAQIVQGAENDKLAAWANRSPAIIINVQRQPGANVIETVDRILAQLPSIQEGLPADLTIQVLTDRTETIRASVKDVQFELMLAIVLVVMVIFVFLRNWRATLIPGVAVPLSLIGTFAVMYLAGYSVNNLTLMALTIATGFVVDDAIVVVENISRYLEQGESPINAALKGAGEIGFTIISLTISLVAVLIPLLFMGDVVGRLFREFAVTLAVAILISGFISLTLTPMMSARLLREGHAHSSGRFGRWSEGFFERLINTYDRSLNWVLKHQKQTLLVALATLVLTLLLFYIIPKGFFPQQDNGVIQGITRASPDISFQAMATRQQEAVDKILQDPDVRSVSSFIGVDGTNASLNSGRLQINLKPLSERSARAPEIIQRLQQRVAIIPGFDIFMQPIQDLTIETTVSPTQYQFTVQAQNMEQLEQWVPRLVTRLQQEKWLQDVATDMQTNAAVAYLSIDRDMLGRLGLSVADVSNVLYNAYGQRMISTIFTQTSQYRVVLGVDPKLAKNLEGLQTLSLTTAKGEVVPLLSVVQVQERRGNLVVSHLDQFPAATVSFNLVSGVALGDAVELIETVKEDLGLPADMLTTFQGSALAFKASLSNQVWLMIAAVVCMYIVLGILYESLIHPVTILSTLPSAGVGALLALMMGGKELSVIAIIGIILLIGIVKKNAIMMIDFALAAEREQGLKPFDAIYQACLLRFRPILMTTMAALLGAVPLMLSTGVGAELRQPLGIAMVGGLILSQILTLYTTPVIYLMFDRLATRWRQRGAKASS